MVGWYCPKANTDPEALKKNTPKERVEPVAPPKPKAPVKPTPPAPPAELTAGGLAPRPSIGTSDKYSNVYNEIAV